MLNPVNHTRTPAEVPNYRVEPYVVAADVYSGRRTSAAAAGPGTPGSAGWMYRVGLEAILGLKRHASELVIEPCLPPEWTRASVSYRFGDTTYDIAIVADCDPPRQVARVVIDGAVAPGGRLQLVDDGEMHRVEIEMRNRQDSSQ